MGSAREFGGAPFIVADLSTYAMWGGSHGSNVEGFRFAAWGALAKDLHEVIPVRTSYPDREAALADLERLVPALEASHPEAKIRSAGWEPSDPQNPQDFLSAMRREGSGGDYTVLIAGQGRLRLSFKVETDYDRVVMGTRDDRNEAFVAPFANAQVALWQTMGGCVIDVGTTRGGSVDEFVRLAHGFEKRGDKGLRALRKSLSARSLEEESRGDVVFSEGIAVIADSSFHATDFIRDSSELSAVEVLRATAYLRGPTALNAAAILGVGTILPVEPGAYEVFEGSSEDVDARWCRLRLGS